MTKSANVHSWWAAWVVAVLVLAVLGGWRGQVAAEAITDDTVVQAVASAKTASDHAALAAYFLAKSADAAAKTKQHQAMLDSFSGKPKENWRSHCNNLITSYRQQQKDYEALAKEQDDLAKSASQ